MCCCTTDLCNKNIRLFDERNSSDVEYVNKFAASKTPPLSTQTSIVLFIIVSFTCICIIIVFFHSNNDKMIRV